MDSYSNKRQWKKLLFNFLVWITGLSDLVELHNFVKTADDVQQKLLYVAQDIIYIYIYIYIYLQRERSQCPRMLHFADHETYD